MKPRVKWSAYYQKWYAPHPMELPGAGAVAFVIEINRVNKKGVYSTL